MFVPYLPISKGKVVSFDDGEAYGKAMLASIESAEQYVLLTGLHFMADFQLVRPDKSKRLATVLKRASRNAHVFLLVNQFFSDEGRMNEKAKKVWAIRAKAYRALMKQGELNSYLEETYKLFEELKTESNIHARTSIHPHPLFGTHHQKTVVVDGKIAYLGGIDLTFIDGDRWDTPDHGRKYRASTRTQQFWHDIHMSVEGPAVDIVKDNFRQRWENEELNTLVKKISGAASGSPKNTIHIKRDKTPPSLPKWRKPRAFWLPPSFRAWAENAKRGIGRTLQLDEAERKYAIQSSKLDSSGEPIIQIVRSMPESSGWHKQKPDWILDSKDWERSAKDAYLIGISNARKYIYLENQWIADEGIWDGLLKAAKRNKKNKDFRIILVVPFDGLEAARLGANQDGGFLLDRNIKRITKVIGDRFGMYSPISWKDALDPLERPQIYVHSKIMIVDDIWTLIGSANAGGISLEGVRSAKDKPDSELSAIVLNKVFASRLRQKIWSEHLREATSIDYSSADADKYRQRAKAKRKRIRFCPTYKAPVYHRLLKPTLREVQALSRIEIYGVDVERGFSMSALPRFRVIVAFPVPATNWGIYLQYRWVLRLGKIGANGSFVGHPGKNYKLLTVDEQQDTFRFGFYTSTVVGKKTADAIQAWFVSNAKTDQQAEISCRVRLTPFKNENDYTDVVLSRGFLLLEKGFAEANAP